MVYEFCHALVNAPPVMTDPNMFTARITTIDNLNLIAPGGDDDDDMD